MIIKKRLLPLVLCVFLLVPLFNVSQYEAYAMDIVITPFVAKCVLTGLVACGVGIASNSDADSIVNDVWSNMSSDLKKSIITMSSLKEGIEAGVSMWTSAMWSDFKSMVNTFFSSDGGFVFSVPVGDSLMFPVDKVNKMRVFASTDGFIPMPGYKNMTYSVTQSLNGAKCHFIQRFYFSPFSDKFLDSDKWVDTGSEILLPDVSRPPSQTVFLRMYYEYWNGKAAKLDQYYKLFSDGSFNYLVYDDKQLAKFPISVNLNNMIYAYVTGDYQFVVSNKTPYVVDKVYYPSATGSICPDVPVNKVLSLPLVNDVAGVTSADLVGSATFTDVGFVDIPVDVPVVPVVPPVPPIEVPTVPGNTLDFSPLFAVRLRNVFPFCIPFDFAKLIKSYASAPLEPSFNIDIDNKYLTLHHKIDIAPIQFPLKFFRTTAIFLFIWILISKTKDLMKW